MMAIAAARQLAHDHLAAPLPRRWQHVQAVADEAHRLADAVGCDLTTLACAAWLHDIGYAPHLVDTGFHPLDGARFLRGAGWPYDICNLVAHHSCARLEANERNLGRELLAEFTDTPTPERDALWTADATTGPDGQRMTLDQRVHEVVERYGTDHLVARCMRRIRPELDAAITRTLARSQAREHGGETPMKGLDHARCDRSTGGDLPSSRAGPAHRDASGAERTANPSANRHR